MESSRYRNMGLLIGHKKAFLDKCDSSSQAAAEHHENLFAQAGHTQRRHRASPMLERTPLLLQARKNTAPPIHKEWQRVFALFRHTRPVSPLTTGALSCKTCVGSIFSRLVAKKRCCDTATETPVQKGFSAKALRDGNDRGRGMTTDGTGANAEGDHAFLRKFFPKERRTAAITSPKHGKKGNSMRRTPFLPSPPPPKGMTATRAEYRRNSLV